MIERPKSHGSKGPQPSPRAKSAGAPILAQTKPRAELTTMNDRLLNAFLAGAIDEPTFDAERGTLRDKLAVIEASMANPDYSSSAYSSKHVILYQHVAAVLPKTPRIEA